MSGDFIQQYGPGSIGKAETNTGDIVAGGTNVESHEFQASAINDLLAAVQELKQHLDDSDRVEVEAAAREINANISDERRFKELLQRIAGVATVVGEAGAPVIVAINALLG